MDPTTLRLIMGAAGGVAAAPVVLEDGVATAASINFTTTPAANTLILAFAIRGGTSNPGTPSGYTLISSNTANNARLFIWYKVAVGNETSVASSNADITGYAFVSVGAVLDVTGTMKDSSGTSVTATAITPASSSLVFLCVGCNNNSNTPTNDGGFSTIVFDTTTELVTSKEITVWTKAGTGASTGDATVTFSGNGIAAVQFSVRF